MISARRIEKGSRQGQEHRVCHDFLQASSFTGWTPIANTFRNAERTRRLFGILWFRKPQRYERQLESRPPLPNEQLVSTSRKRRPGTGPRYLPPHASRSLAGLRCQPNQPRQVEPTTRPSTPTPSATARHPNSEWLHAPPARLIHMPRLTLGPSLFRMDWGRTPQETQVSL